MNRFVRVRLVQTNALDLGLFQFDFDLTFAVFFMNADETIYGRFGSRSDFKEATRDISMEGFRQALAAALEIHRQYPANRAALAGKKPAAVKFKKPGDYPSLKGKYTDKLDYEGNVTRSCIHCHQVGEAERRLWRAQRKPVPDRVLYPWPMPDVVGFSLDRDQTARVTRVTADSPAAAAGLQAGDDIVTLENQPLVSIADVQWVLHNATDKDALEATVRRDGRTKNLMLTLPSGWRRQSDFSWRTTTWDLRRMAIGGLVLKDMPADARREAGLAKDALALRVTHVGQYGEHAVAKRAGVKKGDVIVGFDGLRRRMTESQLLAHALQHRMAGKEVAVAILRDGERITLKLLQQ